MNTKYAVIVDAGSSGSRAHIYSWPDPQSFLADLAEDDSRRAALLPISTDASWATKVKPGISFYDGNTTAICTHHIKPLLEKAYSIIPREHLHETPLYFLATAGLRLVEDQSRKEILQTVCSCVQDTAFKVPECQSHVAMIDGEAEGLYGWLGLNYMVNTGLHGKWDNFENTFGFLDMGGASAQIAFVPSGDNALRHKDDLHTLRLRTVKGDPVEWNAFVTTWLGFGANKSLLRLRKKLIAALSDKEKSEPHEVGAPIAVPDPCLPRGAFEQQIIDVEGLGNSDFLFYGTGSYDTCSQLAEELLNKNKPCKDDPCLFDGVHVPGFDFDSSKFVGVSEYWYTLQDIFGNNGSFDYDTLEGSIRDLCSSDWSSIRARFENGEIAANNEVTLADIQKSCFKATWVLTVLNKGYNFPLKNHHVPGAPHNFESTFQSAIYVEGSEISWTLGRALLYASSEVPATTNSQSVGYAVYGGNWTDGGEALSHTSLPDQLWPADSPSNSRFGLLLLFALVAVLYFVVRRVPFVSLKYFRRRVKLFMSEPTLPVTENSNRDGSASGSFESRDAVEMESFRQGMSTVLTTPSNVPSRVSSRMNLRNEWD